MSTTMTNLTGANHVIDRQSVMNITLWLYVYHMIQQRVWPMGFHIQTYWQYRPTGKIQTHLQNPDSLV